MDALNRGATHGHLDRQSHAELFGPNQQPMTSASPVKV